MSRPPLKTPELLQRILELIFDGHSLSSICRLKGMPARWTIHRWFLEDPEFREAYKEALALRTQEALLDAFEIADRPKANANEIAADRLRVNVRLRAAGLQNAALKGKEPKEKEKQPDREINIRVVHTMKEDYEKAIRQDEEPGSAA